MSMFASRPLLSHNFIVLIDVVPIRFAKVSSVEIGIETQALVEGGENRFVHTLSGAATSEKTLMLERGVASDLATAITSTLANTLFRVGSRYSFVSIIVLDQNRKPKKVYVANDVILKKRRLSELDAMSGEVFVESMELIYKDMTEVPGVNILSGAIQAIF